MKGNDMNQTIKRYGVKEDNSAGGRQQQQQAQTPVEVTEKDVQAMVTKAVAEGLKTIIPTIQEAIAPKPDDKDKKGAKSEDKSEDKKEPKQQTQADIQGLIALAVAEEFKKSAKDHNDEQRRGNKMTGEPNDLKQGGRVETPTSWCKGNLPLHGKQLLNICMRKGMNDGISESMLTKGVELGDGIVHRMRYGGKVYDGLTSSSAGYGDEFVPTDLSAELQRRLYLASDLYAAMVAQEIDMPTADYTFPITTTRASYYLETTEGTDATGSKLGTGGVTLNSRKIMACVPFSYELQEDSIVPILPWIEQTLAEGAAATLESMIINGDTTATHMDSDTELVAKAPERAWKGLRKLALAVAGLKVDLATGGISAANVRSLKKALGKYGSDTKNLILLVGVKGYNDLLGISEVLTAEKAGPSATILTGKLASIYNIPIIASEAARENLNASGVFDNSTTTKGSVVMFNKRGFLLGRRREFMLETEPNRKGQTIDVIASLRKAFSPVETPSATVPTVAIGYNYTA